MKASTEQKIADEEQVAKYLGSLVEQIRSSFFAKATQDRQSLPWDRFAIIGIQTRGVTLAQRIRSLLNTHGEAEIPLGTLDITLYRDDLDDSGPRPVVRSTDIPFNLDGYHILLVDDILYTGRTVRAALDELVDFGRPASVRLAVLIDRGHREFPIHADFVGTRLTTKKEQMVKLRLCEVDGMDEVLLFHG